MSDLYDYYDEDASPLQKRVDAILAAAKDDPTLVWAPDFALWEEEGSVIWWANLSCGHMVRSTARTEEDKREEHPHTVWCFVCGGRVTVTKWYEVSP